MPKDLLGLSLPFQHVLGKLQHVVASLEAARRAKGSVAGCPQAAEPFKWVHRESTGHNSGLREAMLPVDWETGEAKESREVSKLHPQRSSRCLLIQQIFITLLGTVQDLGKTEMFSAIKELCLVKIT